MNNSYERTSRAEVLKECLSSISGKLFRLNIKEAEELSKEAGILANNLLLPEYDDDLELNKVEEKLKEYQIMYEKLKKGI